MSKVNQIEDALCKLSQGSFQKLADAYLHRKGYDKINPLGSVIGTNKAKKGTPDTFVSLPNGKYLFAEYTTQQSGICKKFKKDIDKCFDEEKTGVPVEMIEELVLCYTSTLTTKEERFLANECQKRGVNLNIFGIGISFDIYRNYPELARDFLGVEIDTGQILPPEEFVATYNKNKVVTRLDTAFHFRDDEVEQVLHELEAVDLVMVSGRPGVGKSRVALECCKRFNDSQPEYVVRCIFNRGLNLYEDLRSYFSEPGHFLILVDDANRISKFEYIVHLLQDRRENQQIKVIVTVRDYALYEVQEAARQLGSESSVELHILEDTQIKHFVKDECGILNPFYLDRIAKIARGNPRLAIMAAEVASQENTLESISDVTALYEEYFTSIKSDIEDFNDINVLKAAGIVAFFQSVDRTNGEMMSSIEKAFGIPKEVFWEATVKLHDLEVLDIYENDVVRVSDQVLATYLFYLAFFKERALDFSAILNHFFPRLRHRLVEAVNPVMIAFDSKKITEDMRPHIDKIWKSMEEKDDHQSLLHLMDVFWFISQTDTLVYVKNCIQEMEAKPTDLSKLEFEASSLISFPSILSVLGSFEQANDDETLRMALTLLFDYLAKLTEELSEVLHILINQFGFRPNSYIHGFAVQRAVIDVLWNRTLEGNDTLYSNLFIALAEKYLHTSFHTTESKGRSAFMSINFQLAPTPELFDLRQAIWKRLFQLYKTSTFKEGVLCILKSYSTSGCLVSANDIVAKDATEVLPFIESELDTTSQRDCLLVHKYLDHLDRCEVSFNQDLRNQFTNEYYNLSKVVLFDRSDMKCPRLSREKYEQFKKKIIKRHFGDFCFADYKQFFEQCQKIQSELDGHKFFLLVSGVEEILLALADQNSDLFIEVLDHYIKMGDPLGLKSYKLSKKLVEICGSEGAYEVLSKPEYQTKRVWLFGYYISLPTNAVNHEHLDQLYSIYKEAEITELQHSLDFLLGYRSINEDVIAQVTEIVLKKIEENSGSIYPLLMMFDPSTDINKAIIELFAKNLDLLKRAYFASLKADSDMDYDGKTFTSILNKEPNFILEYLDWMYKEKKRLNRYDDTLDYTFIWVRDDYEYLMIQVTEYIYEREVEREFLQSTYLETYFVLKNNEKDNATVMERQDRFLKCLIERQHDDPNFMEFIFSVIANFTPERRLPFVVLLLEHNKKLELFQRIPLMPNSWGYTGSAVPVLQKRADYLEKLLPLLNTVDLLEHKQYVERQIRDLHSDIELEKKSDFMGY